MSDVVKGALPPLGAKKGIEVVALHKGVFQCRRKSEGDKFVVESFDQLGSWMRCTDKGQQLEHEKAMASKKEAMKKAVAGK